MSAIISSPDSKNLAKGVTDQHESDLEKLGRAANNVAAKSVFDDYRSRKSANTLKAQDNSLRLFAEYISLTGVRVGDLLDAESWKGVTWGLVEGFVRVMLNGYESPAGSGVMNYLGTTNKNGKEVKMVGPYAVTSTNLALSTVKTYAKLAYKAGVLDKYDYLLIKDVSGYSPKEIENINAARGDNTRKLVVINGEPIPVKKSRPILLSVEDVLRLKHDHPDTEQGRRDRLLMCLLFDHGLRCSEVADLKVENLNLQTGMMNFYRKKVKKWQKAQMTRDTLLAAQSCAAAGDLLKNGKLILSTRKGGDLVKQPYKVTRTNEVTGKTKTFEVQAGMTTRSITARVNTLGKRLKIDTLADRIENLSAHDCRHTWATRASEQGTALKTLKSAGGWNSLAMPDRYVAEQEISNQGVILPY